MCIVEYESYIWILYTILDKMLKRYTTLTFEARTSEDLLRVCSLESLIMSSVFFRDDAGEL